MDKEAENKLLEEIRENIRVIRVELEELESGCRSFSQQANGYPQWKEECFRVEAIIEKFKETMVKRWTISFPYRVGDIIIANNDWFKGGGNYRTIREIKSCTVLVSNDDEREEIPKEDVIRGYQRLPPP